MIVPLCRALELDTARQIEGYFYAENGYYMRAETRDVGEGSTVDFRRADSEDFHGPLLRARAGTSDCGLA